MVGKAQAPQAHPHPHDMLTPPGRAAGRPRSPSIPAVTQRGQRQGQGPGETRDHATRTARTHHTGPQARIPDTMSVTLGMLLLMGLVSIGLAMILVYTLNRANSEDSSGWMAFSLRTLHAEQTRDAQQLEIAQLERELEGARRASATAVAQPPPLPTAAPIPTAQSWQQPPLALILSAPVYKQQRSLSCESSAASMAANFFGVTASEQSILDALPIHENPHLGFRGNVDGPYGGIEDYGVYAEPVRVALAELGLEVEHLTGGIEAIKEHLRQGRLVIAWITYELQPQSPSQVLLSDGQVVTLVPYEHVVLVVGYNEEGLWVNDPYSGTRTFYPEGDFVRSFAYLSNMGLVVNRPEVR